MSDRGDRGDRIDRILMEEWEPISGDELARRLDMKPAAERTKAENAQFMVEVWKAAQRHREATGRQFKWRKGFLVKLTDAELAKYSRRNARAARRKEERAIARAVVVTIDELPENLRNGHRRFIERSLNLLALRKLASGYKDPFEGIAEALKSDAKKAVSDRSMRAESIKKLSAVAKAHNG